MQKELIISATPQETKIAILEDDELVEFYIERHHHLNSRNLRNRLSPTSPDAMIEANAVIVATGAIAVTGVAAGIVTGAERNRRSRHLKASPMSLVRTTVGLRRDRLKYYREN